MTVNNWTFDPNDEDNLPVELDFTGIVTFRPNVTAIPGLDVLFGVMEDANYARYIMEFVWTSPPTPGNLFFDVERTVFTAAAGQVR